MIISRNKKPISFYTSNTVSCLGSNDQTTQFSYSIRFTDAQEPSQHPKYQ